MLSVTETVFIGLGSGLLLFMFIPCCAYWFRLYDVSLFSRHEEPLHGTAVI
jgi:hypothetical protein